MAVQKGEIDSLSACSSRLTLSVMRRSSTRALFSNVRISVEKRANGQPYLRLVSASVSR